MNRKDYPMLDKIVFLDSAAGTLKPKIIADEVSDFYLNYAINPHSHESEIGLKVVGKIQETREMLADWLEATPKEVIFTSGTTDSLNRFAIMVKPLLKPGDVILVNILNHLSNIAPWVKVANETGAIVKVTKNILKDIKQDTKLVCYAQVNNSFWHTVDPIAIYKRAKEVGAIVVNDAAQAVTYQKVSLKYADAIPISANKIYGPTGIGALLVKQELQDKLDPAFWGGGAIGAITPTTISTISGVGRHEPGTANTAGIYGLNAALKYYFANKNYAHIQGLADYAFKELSSCDNVIMHSKPGDQIILFNIKNVYPKDFIIYMGKRNIILRAGRHCATYLLDDDSKELLVTVRISFGLYNNKEDIDKVIEIIKEGGDFFEL